MATMLERRGPDDQGSWVDPDAGIALGHRRLSIIDLSVEGHQPMASASGRYIIAFNGEIYNFQQLRQTLDRTGVVWRGHSDTEVMLAACESWGIAEALQQFNGMFAFALWDRQERTLHLARDRAGEKPLYYGWIGNTFLFASELKALCVHPSWRGELERAVIPRYLQLNYVPAPFSIYKGIRKLPAAHRLEVTSSPNDTGDPEPYWSMLQTAQCGASRPLAADETSAVEELERLLSDAVRLRMIADVPLGVFLSGGVDSSTILALMQAQSSRRVRSFSIGFLEQRYDEARHAKAVAAHLGTEHTEFYVTPRDALAVIPDLPDIYDEPFADASQIPTLLVSRLARRHVTVALSGDGGDEFFGGYVRYFWGRRIWNHMRMLPPSLRAVAGGTLTRIAPKTWNTLAGAVSRHLPFVRLGELTGDRVHKFARILGAQNTDALYQALISHWDHRDGVAMPGDGWLAHTSHHQQEQVPLGDFTLRMMYLDGTTYLPDDVLVKVDRAAMSVGLETRAPLLDHRVIEFAWRAPLSMKLRERQGKWLLRQVLYRYVPRELIERPKMGFGVPIDAWLRGPLRDWAEALLDERRLRDEGYFNPTPIRIKWQEHLSGTRNWQYLIWTVLMFQAWLEHQQASRSLHSAKHESISASVA